MPFSLPYNKFLVVKLVFLIQILQASWSLAKDQIHNGDFKQGGVSGNTEITRILLFWWTFYYNYLLIRSRSQCKTKQSYFFSKYGHNSSHNREQMRERRTGSKQGEEDVPALCCFALTNTKHPLLHFCWITGNYSVPEAHREKNG